MWVFLNSQPPKKFLSSACRADDNDQSGPRLRVEDDNFILPSATADVAKALAVKMTSKARTADKVRTVAMTYGVTTSKKPFVE